MKPKPLQIAFLGDVHGHLSLALTVLKMWEAETHRRLDLIVQLGDFGAFPPPYKLDKATARFAKDDPEELGFTHYFEGDEEAVSYLGGDDAAPEKRIDAKVLFIRGNHEDFGFLDEMARGEESSATVDALGRIEYLANGRAFTLDRRGHSVTFAALGGISGERGEAGHDPLGPLYTEKEVRTLWGRRGQVDVLLSHEPPRAMASALGAEAMKHGSEDVARLIEHLRPRYHFCGHWHEPGFALDAPEGTQSYELNAVNFQRAHAFNRRCMGVLSWTSRDEHEWSWVEGAWLSSLRKQTWRSVL